MYANSIAKLRERLGPANVVVDHTGFLARSVVSKKFIKPGIPPPAVRMADREFIFYNIIIF